MPSVMIVTENGKFQTLLMGLLASTSYDTLEVAPSTSLAHLQMITPEPEAIVIGSDTQTQTDLLDTLERFRRVFPIVPIVVIASRADVGFVVQVMRAGADSYFLPSELNAESLSAVIDDIRQAWKEKRGKNMPHSSPLPSSPRSAVSPENIPPTHDTENPAAVQVDELVIDNQKLNASFRDIPLDLSPTEFEILSYLAHSAGQVVTFEELVFHVYGIRANRDQARRTLAAHISNLRGKLREVGGDDYLVNRRGRGYLIEREATAYPMSGQLQEHYIQAMQVLTSQIQDIAICLYDRDQNIITSAGQILAGQTDQAEHGSLSDFFFAEGRTNFESQLDAVFDQQSSHFEHEHQGRSYTIDLLPITVSSGDTPLGMILVQDISIYKQLDSLVDGELEELTAKIMTQVTGEIRAILTALQTSTEMLVRYRERLSEDEQIARLGQIHAHVNHLVEHFEAIATLSQTFSNRQH